MTDSQVNNIVSTALAAQRRECGSGFVTLDLPL